MNLVKRGLVSLILLFVLLPSVALAKETISLDGGIIVDGRTMLPLRSIFEALDATVTWNGEDKSILATKEETIVRLKINEKQAFINGNSTILEVPPTLLNGQTIVPVRFVSEVFGAKVSWNQEKKKALIETSKKDIIINVEKEKIVKITISAAGDVTLGRDENYGYYGSFDEEAKKNGYAFFVKNIKDLFSNDDFTTVNLETTLTNATKKANKKFRFKGDPAYTEILKLGSIEAVNLANNHTYDYLQKGYDDTITNLKKEEIGYFGNEHSHIEVVKGIKIGAVGFKGWSDTKTVRKQIKNGIDSLKEKGAQVVIVHFHWGEERNYVPNQTQKNLGRYTIESGADLVLGHHPHVVQGIEEYKDKFIVYSLGNFMFGGNKNPSDKDTIVFQQTFHIKDGKLTDKKEINVIPFSISSVTHRNNYQPTPMNEKNANKLTQKLISLSEKISDTDWILHDNKAFTYDK